MTKGSIYQHWNNSSATGSTITRNNHIKSAGAYTPEKRRRCAAYHEAGHAAAIYLFNRAREIPHLFSFRSNEFDAVASEDFQAALEGYIASVEDGPLLQAPPPALNDSQHQPKETGHDWIQFDLLNALEADVVYLLAGPLSEAKYVAETDDEIFTHRLINPSALKNYGGASDLALISNCMRGYSGDPHECDQKLNQLHQVAFNFINDYDNWQAIRKLAEYILEASKTKFCDEEVAAMLRES